MPLSDIPRYVPGQPIYLALHADVVMPTGEIDSAWAEGSGFPGGELVELHRRRVAPDGAHLDEVALAEGADQPVPAGYGGLAWDQVGVYNPNGLWGSAVKSETNLAFIAEASTFEVAGYPSPAGSPALIEGDMAFVGAWFSAAQRDDLPITVSAYDDGVLVGRQVISVDRRGPTWFGFEDPNGAQRFGEHRSPRVQRQRRCPHHLGLLRTDGLTFFPCCQRVGSRCGAPSRDIGDAVGSSPSLSTPYSTEELLWRGASAWSGPCRAGVGATIASATASIGSAGSQDDQAGRRRHHGVEPASRRAGSSVPKPTLAGASSAGRQRLADGPRPLSMAGEPPGSVEERRSGHCRSWRRRRPRTTAIHVDGVSSAPRHAPGPRPRRRAAQCAEPDHLGHPAALGDEALSGQALARLGHLRSREQGAIRDGSAGPAASARTTAPLQRLLWCRGRVDDAPRWRQPTTCSRVRRTPFGSGGRAEPAGLVQHQRRAQGRAPGPADEEGDLDRGEPTSPPRSSPDHQGGWAGPAVHTPGTEVRRSSPSPPPARRAASRAVTPPSARPPAGSRPARRPCWPTRSSSGWSPRCRPGRWSDGLAVDEGGQHAEGVVGDDARDARSTPARDTAWGCMLSPVSDVAGREEELVDAGAVEVLVVGVGEDVRGVRRAA